MKSPRSPKKRAAQEVLKDEKPKEALKDDRPKKSSGWAPGGLRVGSGRAPGGLRAGSGRAPGGLRVGSERAQVGRIDEKLKKSEKTESGRSLKDEQPKKASEPKRPR